MDASLLNTKVAAGYAKAASVVGLPCAQYRPTTSAALGSQIGTVTAAFDQDASFGFKKPWNRIKAEGFCLTDPTLLLDGDYLFGIDPYFVQRIEDFRPVEVVLCNHVLSFSNEAASGGTVAGANPYPTPQTPASLDIATGWPASVLLKTRGEADPAKLPSDVRAAYFEVLLPAIPGVQLEPGYRATDEIGNSYQLTSVELTAWGYRLLILLDQV